MRGYDLSGLGNMARVGLAALALFTPMEAVAQCPQRPDRDLVYIAEYLTRNGERTNVPNVTVRIRDNVIKSIEGGYSTEFTKHVGVVFEGGPVNVRATYTDSGKTADNGQSIADGKIGPEDIMEFFIEPESPFREGLVITDGRMNGCLKEPGDGAIKVPLDGNYSQGRYPHYGGPRAQRVGFTEERYRDLRMQIRRKLPNIRNR
jgi:hypothetical protein